MYLREPWNAAITLAFKVYRIVCRIAFSLRRFLFLLLSLILFLTLCDVFPSNIINKM